MGKRWDVKQWDICMHLHSMSDFGHSPGGGFSRSRTSGAECYAAQDGIKCDRQGVCIKARLRRRRRG